MSEHEVKLDMKFKPKWIGDELYLEVEETLTFPGASIPLTPTLHLTRYGPITMDMIEPLRLDLIKASERVLTFAVRRLRAAAAPNADGAEGDGV